MSGTTGNRTDSGQVTLHYWASIRAAAGTDSDVFDIDGAVTLAELLQRAKSEHADSRTREPCADQLLRCSRSHECNH